MAGQRDNEPITEYTSAPTAINASKRDAGPELDNAVPVPKNNPVPKVAPIAMNCK